MACLHLQIQSMDIFFPFDIFQEGAYADFNRRPHLSTNGGGLMVKMANHPWG